MKLRSVTYALFIAGLAAFSTSSLAAQSLRFGYETSQTDSQHIAAKKFIAGENQRRAEIKIVSG